MLTVSAFVTARCNMYCKQCIAGSHDDIDTVLDVDQLLKWCAQFTPGCAIHITGGEPTTRKDIVELLVKCVDAGHQTTLFTNGKRLNHIDGIKELPIIYHVTHHASQGMTYDDFFSAIDGIPKDRLIVCRRFCGRDALNDKLNVMKIYKRAGYELHWINMFSTYHKKPSADECAKDEIIMVGQYGEVFPCSTIRHGQLGNIYDMTFNGMPEKFCFNDKCKSKCQALLSATKTRVMHEDNIIHGV